MAMSKEMQLVVQKSLVAETGFLWEGPIKLKEDMQERSKLWNIAMDYSKTYMCLVDLGTILGLWLAKREDKALEWMKNVRDVVLELVNECPRVGGGRGLKLKSYPFTKEIKDRFIEGKFHPNEGMGELNRFIEWICVCGATRNIKYDKWWQKFVDAIPEDFPWKEQCDFTEIASVQISDGIPRIRLVISTDSKDARDMYAQAEYDILGSSMAAQWVGRRGGSSECPRGGKGARKALWELPTCSIVLRGEGWKKQAFSRIVLFSMSSILFLNRDIEPKKKMIFD